MNTSNISKKPEGKSIGFTEWQPSQKDKDWRYLTKEQFLAKYPDEDPRWYHEPPAEKDFWW